jgi:uncharacterized protein (TIGR03118 family)
MRQLQTVLTVSLLLTFATRATWATGFVQTNLVSTDSLLPAVQHDPSLINPWGIATSGTSPFWVSDNGAGVATLYNGNTGVKTALTVTIPPPGGGSSSTPTGVVFNSTTSDFQLASAKATFIFATEDGTISGWNTGSNAILKVDNSGSQAVYKGLALAASATGNDLYAANFNSGKIDVFNSTFQPITTAGSFTDPNLPAGYAPFNIQLIGTSLFVTYAKQDAAKHDDVPGAGNGFVDKYDTNGNFVSRFASAGPLDSPWGLTLAPASFGQFAGDLLVGNFGDGKISAFDPTTGAFLGQLADPNGNPLAIDGLWGLIAGSGGSAGDPGAIYFTAGLDNETLGLFGSITTPEPASLALLGLGTGALMLGRKRRR